MLVSAPLPCKISRTHTRCIDYDYEYSAWHLFAHAQRKQAVGYRDVLGALRLAQLCIPTAAEGPQAYASAHLAAGSGVLHVQWPAAGMVMPLTSWGVFLDALSSSAFCTLATFDLGRAS